MTRKIISLVTAIGILSVYLQSQLQPNEALFFFISNNLLINIGMVVLAALAVGAAFADKFRHWQTYAAAAGAGVFFGVIGLAGVMLSSTYSILYDVLQPLDYLLLLEFGIIFGICALTYKHQPVPFKLPAYRLPDAGKLKRRLAAWLPEPAIHPGGSRPRAI